MICSACQHENPEGARFCNACAAPLAARCASCGGDNPPGSRFCNACAAPLAGRPAPEAAAARKVVTIVFADLVGSTAMHERLDAESVRRFMDRYYAAMRTAVEAHGGRVTQLLGDGVLAIFGAPRVAEDDALRAVRAGVAMQRAFRALVDAERGAVGTTGLRVAVNTGEVVANEGAEIIGDPVNVAARLQDEGRDGDVVVGEATARLVADAVTLVPLGTFALKGRAERVAAYRVESLERPAGTPATAFVGREDELRRLAAVFDDAVTTPAGRLAVLLGSPGLGKSRLLHELGRRLGDRATVLTARLGPTGGATFAPLAEALRTFVGIDDAAGTDAVRTALAAHVTGDESERTRIAHGVAALLAGTPVSPEETFFAVRRFLAALAGTRPVVLVLDDLHWAEPLLLDLTEHLVQWSGGVPLLIVAAARPELREARSALVVQGGLVHDVVTLAGLDASAATRLAANVIGADELPAVVAGRVLATSEGNPLFVSELVRMLVHDGVLKREGARWTIGVEIAQLEMPPTIHALLAARLERLAPEERLVLERAAVVGRQFSRAAIAHLLPPEIANLPAKLEALRRSELIEPDTGWFLGEPMLRFHHALIRDAAYRRLLKETRAELHARFADWLEARVGDTVEHDETLGWHLEQAHQHRAELGPLDDAGRALGARAARYLGAAGQRALARDDVPLAANLLGRAVASLGTEDPTRADLALDWCEALLAAGDVAAASTAIAELGRFVAESERLRAWYVCFTGQLAVLTDPQALRATSDGVAAAATTLAAAGDAAGEAKAHWVHATALARLGQIGACEAALDRALAAARQAGDRRRANAVLAGAPLAALWGPSPVTRASGRCLDVVRVLRITHGAPAVEAVALRCQAVLEALRGRSEAARRMIASSRRMVEELGIMHRVLEADVFAGLIEFLEGDAAAAERSLRAAYEGLRDHGLAIDTAQAAALLGRVLLTLGRADEAEHFSHEAEALAGDDLQSAIAWRGVRAEALARRGEHAAAIDCARAAVDLAASTDALLVHGDARLALAAVLHAAGRHAEGDTEETRALELWQAKGASLLAERARDRVASATPTAPAAGEAAAQRGLRSPVRTNLATANLARVTAAIKRRDVDAVVALFGDGLETIHHTSGTSYDRDAAIDLVKFMLAAGDLRFDSVPLATLGDRLALARIEFSHTAISADSAPVGVFESEIGFMEHGILCLLEVGPDGRQSLVENFGVARLGAAIARLYERYSAQLADGPARARATATSSAVAQLLELPDRWAFAPDVVGIDHRTVGLEPLRGAEAVRGAVSALLELSQDVAARFDDVLGLRPDALLVRWTQSGTVRASGGDFERALCELWIFGADGLITRWEQFEAASAEAVARFDTLTGNASATASAAPASRRRPRVRPNAATANTARLDAAMARRDLDALADLLADDVETIDHPTGTVYGREGSLATCRAIANVEGLRFHHEALATLGDALGLFRYSVASAGAAAGTFDVGPYESDSVVLVETDARGRSRRLEVFALDRLGDAVTRLYERHAERLPLAAERDRMVAIARSVAALLGPADLDRYRIAYAPDITFVDKRAIGFPEGHGAEEQLQLMRSLFEVADDLRVRVDDVLGLTTEALLLRWVNSGIARTGGGAFERHFVMLWVFGPDGRGIRNEAFDLHREADALARFDELTAVSVGVRPAARRVRPNAATEHVARFDAAFAAGDPDVFGDLHHPTGLAYGRAASLDDLRRTLANEGTTVAHVPLATLGDRLVLCRRTTVGRGMLGKNFDVGAFEIEQLVVVEVAASGRRERTETFTTDRLNDAITRLYERHAELLPEGPAREHAVAVARTVAVTTRTLDPDLQESRNAPDLEAVDHQLLGTWSARGRAAMRQHLQSMLDLVDDAGYRQDEILDLRPEGLVTKSTFFGTARDGGGTFERFFIVLWVFGPDALVRRVEWFDADREGDALARFDALLAGVDAASSPRGGTRPARRFRPNAATAGADHFEAVMMARDAAALPALIADDAEVIDHTTGVTYDGTALLRTYRGMLRVPDFEFRERHLATLGDRLALGTTLVAGTGITNATFDVGPYEVEHIRIGEVDARGRLRRIEQFAMGRLPDAIARLYERHAELLPEGPARARAAAVARSVAMFVSTRFDVEAYGEIFADDATFADHRAPVTLPPARGKDEMRARLRSWFANLDDVEQSVHDVLGLRPDGLLVRRQEHGRDQAGGTYEIEFLTLGIFDGEGLIVCTEMYAVGREAEALARFEALTRTPAATPPAESAATRTLAQAVDAMNERAWDRWSALFAPEFRGIDRRTILQNELGREEWLASYRPFVEMTTARSVSAVLATRGDRLVLARYGWEGTDGLVGPSEIECLLVSEVNGRGEHVAMVLFDPGDVDTAYAELDRRFIAGEGAATGSSAPQVKPNAATVAMDRLQAAYEVGDWETVRALLAAASNDDRRRHTQVTRTPEQWIADLQTARKTETHYERELVATAGGRVDVERVLWTGGPPDGPFEIEHLWVTEVDATGRIVAIVSFDVDDRRAALREAWTRCAADERTATVMHLMGEMREAYNDHDRRRLRAVFADDLVAHDHRLTGIGLVENPDAFVDWLATTWDLAPDVEVEYLYQLATESWGSVGVARTVGTLPDGGTFEVYHVGVMTISNGVMTRLENYDLADVAAALARFDELRPKPPAATASPPAHDPLAALLRPNLATRATDRWEAAVVAHDWNAVRAIFPEGYEDRRRLVSASWRREQWIDIMQKSTRTNPIRVERRVVSTAGERVHVERQLWTGGPPDGPIESENLWVVEADEAGHIVAVVGYDVEDWRAAERDAWQRWLAAEPQATASMATVRAIFDAFNDRDVARIRALLADDVIFHDHRLAGVGRLRIDAYADWLTATWELAPEIQAAYLCVLAYDASGSLGVVRTSGKLHDGGSFEIYALGVERVEQGRLTRVDLYELADVDAARAQFESMRASMPRDPLAALLRPNAATAAMDRLQAALAARDWAAVRDVYPESATFDDRRRRALISWQRDQFIDVNRDESLRYDIRLERELLATAGEHLQVEHQLWTGGPPDGPVENENIWVLEVDAAGHIAAIVSFDVGDRIAANREMLSRWIAADGVAAPCMALGCAILDALNARDLAGLRAVLADDLVANDRRLVGVDPFSDADAYVGWLTAAWKLAPDEQVEFVAPLANEPWGSLSIGRTFGTLDQGGTWENYHVGVMTVANGRVTRIENYDLEQLDAARTRFAELRPDPPSAAAPIREPVSP